VVLFYVELNSQNRIQPDPVLAEFGKVKSGTSVVLGTGLIAITCWTCWSRLASGLLATQWTSVLLLYTRYTAQSWTNLFVNGLYFL